MRRRKIPEFPTAFEAVGIATRTNAPPDTPATRAAVSLTGRRNLMAIDDIATKLDPSIPHKTCAVCHHMADRGDAWAEKLRAMLRNRGIKFRDLAKALADDPDEPNIPASTLGRHAQRGCSAQEQLR